MFETSFVLFLRHFVLNLLIPFLPWLLFIWIFYGNKIKWFLLYLLAWFIWVWVVAFSVFNIQFIHFGLWRLEYFVILWVLLFIFIWKIFIKKQKIDYYIETLKIESIFGQIKDSFCKLSITERIFTIIISIYSIYFICISWIFNFNLPTYWVDSFWNWNNPAYNIYIDWWIQMFWDEGEILWRWRIGYPIQIATYKALISKFAWWINDIYFNTWEWFVFLFWLLFICCVTFKRTDDIFLSILPVWLVVSLPLVFFHSFEWYMDLPLIIYCVLSAWLLYQYLESEDFDYLSLWLLLWFIVCNIKNDGIIVFFPWLLIAFFLVICLNKKLKFTIKWFWKNKHNLWKSLWYFIYFMLPFLFIRLINWLWFNQAGNINSWIWFSDEIHREMFTFFKVIFLRKDNYNLILIILLLLTISLFSKKRKNSSDALFLYSWIFMFLILIAVFLFTIDYQFLADQTTVNRVFTMCFVMILAFSWFLFAEK